jgi:hypothetical protein
MSLTTSRVRTIFQDEIVALGGTVSDVFHDDTRLFARSVLPQFRDVGTDDRLQCGVAIRADAEEIRIHPYVFRLICSNGAIMAHALEARTLLNTASADGGGESAVREAVRACGSDDAFARSTDEIRSAQDVADDVLLSLMPLLTRIDPSGGATLLKKTLGRFFGARDRSRFSLMNALTSLARDTEDPEVRWRLEEAGGGVPVTAPTHPVRRGADAHSLADVGSASHGYETLAVAAGGGAR